MQDLGALRAQPWYVQEIAQSRWDLRVKLGAQRQVPRFNDGADLARQILSYAWQVLDLVQVLGQIGQRLRMVTDHAGCVAVRSNAERVGPLDLQEVGYFFEDLRYFWVLHNTSEFRIADWGLTNPPLFVFQSALRNPKSEIAIARSFRETRLHSGP